MAIISLTLFRKIFILYPKKDKALICNLRCFKHLSEFNNCCKQCVINFKVLCQIPLFSQIKMSIFKNTHNVPNVNQLGNAEPLNQYQVEKTVVVHAVGSIKWA